MIEITPDQRRELAEIFDRFAPECGVVAFGTRVTGGARPWSDLDLALVGPAPLGMSRMGALREQLEESSLPFRVDVVDWHSLNESFRKIIRRDGELLKGVAAVALSTDQDLEGLGRVTQQQPRLMASQETPACSTFERTPSTNE